MSNKRTQVSLERFLQVAVKERDRFPTVESAAQALGLTVNSFKQRASRERKRYPNIVIPEYRTGGGPKIPSEAEAMAIMERLQAQD